MQPWHHASCIRIRTGGDQQQAWGPLDLGLRSQLPTADLHDSAGRGAAGDGTNDAALGAQLGKLEHQTRGLQEQVSDGPSQAPAVAKAVPMPGLTADRFYPPDISDDTLSGYTGQCHKNKHQL